MFCFMFCLCCDEMSKRVVFQVLKNIFSVRKEKWLDYQNMPFYAVAKGRASGIFMTWADCEAQVKGFSGARYKKFDSVVAAQDFISENGGGAGSSSNKKVSESRQKQSLSYNNTPKLKRSHPSNKTSQSAEIEVRKYHTESKSRSNKHDDSVSEDSDTDRSFPSDGLDKILSKQMDDIEKRLKDFEKGVDKIIKKSSSNSRKQAIMIEPPQAKKKRGHGEFETDHEGYVQVYTDGACSANGKSGARAGLGVYWGEGHALNISEPVSGRATNNCGEIQAATRAIKQAVENGVTKLTINTDSQFLINSVTKWMPGWKSKGWKLRSGEPVKNEKDFKDLDSVQHKLNIKWNYVEAHKGVHGNEMADQLAKAGAAMYNN